MLNRAEQIDVQICHSEDLAEESIAIKEEMLPTAQHVVRREKPFSSFVFFFSERMRARLPRRFTPRKNEMGESLFSLLPFPCFIHPAFTLAEVLITLGIIGVVASFTIPTLMNNVQDKQFKEAAKKSFSATSQVISQMKQDNGGSFDQYMMNENSFEPVFKEYFKVIKDCNLDDCVPTAVSSNVYFTLAG